MLRTGLHVLNAVPLLPSSAVQCSVVACVSKLMPFPVYINKLRSGIDLLKGAGRTEPYDRKLSRDNAYTHFT